MEKATLTIVKLVQAEEFMKDLTTLKAKKQLHRNTKLKSLHPYIDEVGIMRVGGRLEHAELSYDEKHPILLPYKHPFTTLVIIAAHTKTLHGGNKLTLAVIRQRYWILNGNRAVKYHLNRCVKCIRFKSQNCQQLMGNLPSPRVTPARPFSHTGVDYAGPIDIRISKGRGNKAYKGYVSIFVCLVTKAIHIEAVSDLTAEAFIAAFKRFTSRRGHVSHMYSDNGSNFILANKILQVQNTKMFKEFNDTIMKNAVENQTEWHFIPPAAPNFGGLWEAGVKSMKYHLKRTIGDAKLTFEELTTVLAQIEACLNSRPICPLSENPDDLDIITPGHFLVGESLMAVASENCIGNSRTVSRWKFCERMHQEVWQKWKRDYLSRLQQRAKWLNEKENLKEGDLVIIKDIQTSPTKWPLGRVTKVQPGKDGLVRVVTMRSRDKEVKRPINKVILLPIEKDIKEQLNNIEGRNNTQQKETDGRKKKANVRQKGQVVSNVAKNSIYCLLLLLSAFTKTTATQNVQPYKITPLTNSAGVYFEELGEVNLVNNHWKIVSYFDLTNYRREFTTMKKSIDKLSGCCANLTTNITEKEYCDAINMQFRHKLSDIEDKDRLLGRNENKQRNARSPFGIIGSIANGLFGILDEECAKNYDQQIAKAKNNEEHLLQLIRNQTTITDSTVNIVKKSEKTVEKQFSLMANQLSDLVKHVNNAENMANQGHLTQILSMIAIHSLLIFENYQNTQDALLKVVIDTYHGKMNPQLLNPHQLEEQLKTICANIPHTYTIPGGCKQLQLRQVYSEITTNTRVNENNIISEIIIPLVNSEKFQLFKLTALPIRHDNKWLYIEPSTEYLIINLHRDQYYPMKEMEMNNCKQTRDVYTCIQHHPIYSRQSPICRCEVQIINHERDLDSSCVLKATNTPMVWTKLHKLNQWIFTLPQNTVFDIICNEHLISTSLNNNGIIELNAGCSIKQSTMTIAAHNTFQSEIRPIFSPSMNLSEQLVIKASQPEFNATPLIKIDHSQEIANIQQQLKIQKEQEKLPNSLSNHDYHHYTLSYGTLILVLALVTAYTYYRRRNARNATPIQRRVDHNIVPIER